MRLITRFYGTHIVMARKQPPDRKDLTNELADLVLGEVKKLALQLGVKNASFNIIEEDWKKADDRKMVAMEV